MIPFSGDYNSILSPYGTYAYTPPMLLFKSFLPWMPQFNCIQSINNLTFNTSVSVDGMSTINTVDKFSDSKPLLQEKSQRRKKNKLGAKIKKYVCDEDSFYLKNKIENEQSSYNNRRRRTPISARKSKQGPQNKNRNILPSIVQQILSFLTKQTKSKSVCEKIFAVTPHPQYVEVTIPRYYYYIKQIKEKQNHYVNQQTLKILFTPQDIGINLFPEAEQQFYLKVARILAKHFLVNVSPFLTLYSKRIIRDKRIEHLATRKALLLMISQLHC